jgi:hypothetical protein
MSKEQDEQVFKVTDKRSFGEDGSPREAAAEESRKDQQAEKAFAGKSRAEVPEAVPPGTGAGIDFPSYVLSYYTQGLVLLGEVPNPYTNKKEEDLEAARHTVDILGMLKDKTKGNLTKEEEQLLESVLYEMRLKYMARINQIKLS